MLSPYLVENRYVAVKRCRHGLFMYNRNDSFVGRSLDLYGEWCDQEIQLLRRFIGYGDVVLDVGANIGTHAIAFANLVGPTGCVHAFEPQRRTYLMLSGNVALNGLENVFCHRAAVGAETGEIDLPPLPPADMVANFGAIRIRRAADDGEKAPLITIDSLNLPNCQLIKIDVEGMEADVAAGAKQTIERCRPFIFLENNDKESSKRIDAILKQIGYRAYWSIHSYYSGANFYCNDVNIWSNTAPSTNLLCVPNEIQLAVRGSELFLGADDDWRACLQRLKERAKSAAVREGLDRRKGSAA